MLTNLRDAFIGQSRSINIVPFHMSDIVSYCAIVTLSLRLATDAADVVVSSFLLVVVVIIDVVDVQFDMELAVASCCFYDIQCGKMS